MIIDSRVLKTKNLVHLQLAIKNDEDTLVNLLSSVTIAQRSVLPNIQAVLLPKKHGKICLHFILSKYQTLKTGHQLVGPHLILRRLLDCINNL